MVFSTFSIEEQTYFIFNLLANLVVKFLVHDWTFTVILYLNEAEYISSNYVVGNLLISPLYDEESK